MNLWQRNAWISLLFFAPLWLIFGQLPILLVYLEGPSFLHLFSFACSTIVGGLLWLFLFFFNKRRKKTGITEYAWSLLNLEILGRKCHQKKDKLNLKFTK